MKIPRLIKLFILPSLFLALSVVPMASSGRNAGADDSAMSKDPWASLPFTAREWARQSLLPYRRIPLKIGGTMSVQEAYDLYLAAGQPEYPDMDTPGLVTADEVSAQIKLSKDYSHR